MHKQYHFAPAVPFRAPKAAVLRWLQIAVGRKSFAGSNITIEKCMSESLPKSVPVTVGDEDLLALVKFAGRLADASRAVIRPYFRQRLSAEDKSGGGDYDPVTVADRLAEEAISEMVRENYPSHGVLGEEYGFRRGSSGLTWVVDPIDGTKAFLTGMPLWGTLIALYDGQAPILGLMDQPYTGERFCGSRFGSTLEREGERRKLAVRPCEGLEQAILQATHPSMFATGSESAAFRELSSKVRLTRYGGDCYTYCMLAYGLLDLVVESDLQPYDIQALIPVIEGAGGIVTNWSGGNAALGGQVVAAGDRRVHEAAMAVLSGAGAESS